MGNRRIFCLSTFFAFINGCQSKEPVLEDAAMLDDSKSLSGFKCVKEKEHAILDLPYWQAIYDQLGQFDSKVGLGFLHPLDFIAYSQLRKSETPALSRNGMAVETDLIFWTVDAPLKPYLTRIGGVPYRSKREPWPKQNGKECTFIAQFCFRDSLDLFPQLPGDLLLVFVTNLDAIYEGGESGHENGLYLEWIRIDEVQEATTESGSASNLAVPRYSGVLHRYYDYAFDTYDSDVIEQQFPNSKRWYNFVNARATKMGATYLELQREWDPRKWITTNQKELGKWSLVGTFYAITPRRKSDGHFIDDPRCERFDRFGQEIEDASLRLPGDPGHIVFFAGKSDIGRAYFIPG